MWFFGRLRFDDHLERLLADHRVERLAEFLDQVDRSFTLDDFERFLAEHGVDHVFVALPLSRYGELPEVYRAVGQPVLVPGAAKMPSKVCTRVSSKS